MGAAYFYHLTDSPLEQTLPMLLGKALEAGWQVEVRGTNHDRLRSLDLALWQGGADAFLPHGMAGGDHDDLQPILLTERPVSGRSCVVSIDGADVTSDEVQSAERVMVIFDGLNGDAVQRAREQWKALTSAECSAQYWAQEYGKWTKKAES